MTLKSLSLKNVLKPSLGRIKIITLLSASSLLLTNTLIAQELNTTTNFPTNYASSNSPNVPTKEIPNGYIKGNYKTKALPYGNTVISPSPSELSLQEAAEIAAQELFKLYNITLTDQTFQMCYGPKDEFNKYPMWVISIFVTPECFVDMTLDAATGELTLLHYQNSSQANKSTVPKNTQKINKNMVLTKNALHNPTKACDKIKVKVSNIDIISEPIDNIEYIGCDYHTCCATATQYSEIAHTFRITTASKKTYMISFSEDLARIVTFSKNID